MLMVSDRLCIIENTLDSDHLYAYTPISPTTALLLVKSKYFFNEEIYGLTRIRFGMKYGIGEPDPFLSEMLKGGFENRLFCAYYSQSTLVEQAQNGCDSIYVKIQSLPNEVFRSFNSIYCEDGKRILFCDREELDKALSMTLSFRNIKVSF